ncbi:MAG: ATP-binding protein, partial [Alphaproteobacteria bacterium]|nr:ATP-binding protein [Alphaproteobacteria bacterium]
KQLASCVSDAIRLKAALKTNEILLRERKAAMDELQRSNAELDDFASIASHDLKEPLRAVVNHASFLSEDYGDQLGEDGHGRLQRMIVLGRRMEKLISNLLYFSRLGRGDQTTKAVNLNHVVAELEATLAEALSLQNARIEIRDPLPRIIGHAPHITALFQNLISNGVKYNDSPEKIVEIGIARAEGDAEANEFETLYVRDNGIGIDDQSRDDVFRMFKRLNSEKAYGEGTGAGLAFVKKIVETHGGEIRLESELGKGTTFFFKLPSEHAVSATDAKDQAA